MIATGTSEQEWAAWPPLRDAPPLDLTGLRRLVVVAPHPDDETFGAAGLMRAAARAGLEVLLVAVTDGEASHPLATPERLRLARQRRGEAAAALRALDLDLVPHRLGVPDGDVRAHERSVASALAELLDASTGCVCPWRHDGHPDHEAAARAALTAAQRAGATTLEYPIWAWEWDRPDGRLAGVPLRRLDLGPADRAAKEAAMGCFTSQTTPLPAAPDVGVIVPPGVVARFRRPYEAFVVGHDLP